MLPLLALIFCAVFVFALLRRERWASASVTSVMWIPTLWLMIAATGRPLTIWLDGGAVAARNIAAASNEAGNALDRWVLSAMGLIGILIIAHRKKSWSVALRRQWPLLVLLAYMFLSTFWSDITSIALKRWAREGITVIMALLILSEPDPFRALGSVLRRCAYILIPFSVVLIKYYPLLGRQYSRWSGIEMWTGVTGQKNQLGRLCMVSLLFLLFSLYRHWRGRELATRYSEKLSDIIVILIGFYLLIGSSSATSIATLILGVLTFISIGWFQGIKSGLGAVALQVILLFLMAYGTAVPFLGGANVAVFTSTMGRDETLTGRTEVWAEVLPARDKRPMLGYGFGSFWTDVRREKFDIPTAHNGYLDVLLELGEIGLGLFAFWLLSCVRQLHRALRSDYDWASLSITLLLISLVYNITESALNSFTEYISAVVLLFCVIVPAHIFGRVVSEKYDSWRHDLEFQEQADVKCT